jgi:hypothetical protein
MLSALVVVLNRVIVAPDERRGHPLPWAILHVGKYMLAAVLAFVIIVLLHGDVLAFAGGYTVALVTLLIIVAGEPTTGQRKRKPDDGAETNTDRNSGR